MSLRISLRRRVLFPLLGVASVTAGACSSTPPSVEHKPETHASVSSASSTAAADQCAANLAIPMPATHSKPQLIARRPGGLDLFYTSPETVGGSAVNSVRHLTYDATVGTWSTETDVGGNLIAAPAAIAWDLFTTPDDDILLAGQYDPTDYRLDELTPTVSTIPAAPSLDAPGTIGSNMALAAFGNTGTFDQFYLGTSGDLRWRHSVEAEVSLGGNLAGDPAAVAWGPNRIDVFARNAADGQLWHIESNTGTWGTPELLGGKLASSPTVTSWGPGRLDVFWRDTSNALQHMAFDNNTLSIGDPESKAWQPSQVMGGGPIAGDPTVASWGGNRLDLVVTDATANQLVHRTYFGDGYWTLNSCTQSPAGNPSGKTCDYGLVAWNLGVPGVTYGTCAAGGEYKNFKDPCVVNYPQGDQTDCPNGTPVTTCNTTQVPIDCWWNAGNKTTHTHEGVPSKLNCVHKPGVPPICGNVPTTTCSALATEAQNAGRANANYHGFGGSITAANAVESEGCSQYNMPNCTCDFDLLNVPQPVDDGPDKAHCGTTPKTDCTTTTVYGPCSKAVHGLYNCGFGTSAAVAPGAALPTTDTDPSLDADPSITYCITDENAPITTSQGTAGKSTQESIDVGNKYTRLVTNLAAARAGTIPGQNNAALVPLLIQQLKLLFETFGADLTPAQQQTIAQFYFAYPDPANTPSCGETFTPPNESACNRPNDLMTIEIDIIPTLNFCARMNSPHVSPAVRALPSVVYRCVDLGQAIASLRAPFIAAGGQDDGTPWAVGTTNTPDASDVCGFKTLRAAYDTWVTTPLSARFNDPRDPRDSANNTEFQARLYLLDRWYRDIEKLYPYLSSEPNAAKVRAAAWTEAQNQEASLWRGVYRNFLPQAEVTAPPSGATVPPPVPFTPAQLVALTHDTLQADHNILLLAFSPYTGPDSVGTAPGTPPLQNAPLIMLLADALEGMTQRMKDVSIYHDMGCAYEGCRTGNDSEMAHLVELLSDVADPALLKTALSTAHNVKDAAGNNLVRPDWLDAYDAILAQHVAIENSLQDMMYGSGGTPWVYANNESLLETSSANTPDPARHLASTMQSVRSSFATYKASGLFNPTARNTLVAGVQQDDIATLRGQVYQGAQGVAAAVMNYSTNLNTMANAVIQEQGLNKTATQDQDQISQKMLAMGNDASDIGGLNRSVDASKKAFSQLAASYANVTAFDSTALVVGQSYGPYVLDASSAKYTGGYVSLIDPVAAQKIVLPGCANGSSPLTCSNKGAIVTFAVNPGDKWSPSCAIQTTGLFGAQTVVPTGPEGYMASYANGTFTAEKNDTTQTDADSQAQVSELKDCIYADAHVGVSFGGSGASFGVRVDACSSISDTQTSTDSNSNTSTAGSQTSATANYMSGIRAPNTPFPGAPAGALLAVVTSHKNPFLVLDVVVVQTPSTSLVLTDDADVFLVTNDLKASSCVVDTTDTLTVNVSTAMHAGDTLAWVNAAVGTVAGNILGSQQSYVDQGRILPEQEATIRSNAWTSLVSSCKASVTNPSFCDTSKLPASVNAFISAMIDQAIQQIALAVQIQASQRDYAALKLAVTGLQDDYNASMEQGRVAELLPEWTLRNLDTELLRAEISQLVTETTYDLYPVLQLRYAATLAAIPGMGNVGTVPGLNSGATQGLGDALMSLVNAQWDASVVTLGNAAVNAAAQLYLATQSLQTPVTPQFVALSFPKPGVTTTSLNSVKDVRDAQVWTQATTGNHKATFHIAPEDLYCNGGPSCIVCTQEVPVVRELGMVISDGTLDSTTDAAFNGRDFQLASASAPTLTFATSSIFDGNNNLYSAGGPLAFQMASDWLSLATPILQSKDPTQAKAKFDAYQATFPASAPPTNGRGLSPFTDFTFDFSPLYDKTYFPTKSPLDQAGQIIVVMEVETRQVGTARTLNWIRTCQ